ncbi:MAG: hypothetical protein LBE57_01785 [Methanosarcinales archaeon]|jgi:membrane protein YqaA with SNARE-associated domain|nr:hypothetical protein [Methanosarcinales archaeon]
MELVNKEIFIYTLINSAAYLFIVSVSVLTGFISAALILFSSSFLLRLAIFLGQNNQLWFILLESVSSAGSIILYFLFQLLGINFMYNAVVREFKKLKNES